MSYIQRLEDLSSRYRLTAIYAFGSRAKDISMAVYDDKAPPPISLSDIDIAILPEVGVQLTLR